MHLSYSQAWACGLLMTAAAVLTGLLSTWIGWGGRHWFWRAGAAILLLVLVALIPATELAIFFAAQLAVVLIPAGVQRLRRGPRRAAVEEPPRPRVQFTLVDLLLAVALAAACVAALLELPRPDAADAARWALVGALAGVATLAAQWATFARRPWWVRVAALVAVPIGCGAACDLSAVGLTHFSFPIGPGWMPVILARHFALFGIGAVLLGGLCLEYRSLRALDRPCGSIARRPIVAWAAGGAALVIVLVCLLPVAYVYCHIVPELPMPPHEHPAVNHYAAILAIGGELNWTAIPSQDVDEATGAARRKLVEENRTRLAQVQELLRGVSVVPKSYDQVSLSSNLKSIGHFRYVARAIKAQAIEAHNAGRDDEAAALNVSQFRLGAAVSRGGLWLDHLVGMAIQSLGVSGLHRSIGKMPGPLADRTERSLRAILAEREMLDTIDQRERYWAWYAYGWRNRTLDALPSAVPGVFGFMSDWSEGTRIAYKRHTATFHLLLAELALRRYRLAVGKDAERLQQLVPKYLAAVPPDPFSGRPLRYHWTDKGPLVYSVGPDGDDDGGKLTDMVFLNQDGDYLLDCYDMPEPATESTTDAASDGEPPADGP